jgi:hypothetical protein
MANTAQILERFKAELETLTVMDRAYYRSQNRSAEDRHDYYKRQEERERIRNNAYRELLEALWLSSAETPGSSL